MANQQEQSQRYKLRVRTYPDAVGAPVFCEVKRRYHDVIVKERARVPDDWAGWLDGSKDDPIPDVQAIHSFVALHQVGGCQSTAMVSYDREPWASVVDDYARVTFDHRIKVQRPLGDTLDVNPEAWRYVDDSREGETLRSPIVLELKFTTEVPLWMVNMVRTLGLNRRSFSKYGRAVECLYTATPVFGARLYGRP